MNDKAKNWSRAETIVAFNLYCKIPFGKINKSNPDVIRLAQIIRRTPSSVGMKLGNLGRFDPELQKRGVGGLSQGSKMDEIVWNEFHGNWDSLAYESERLLLQFQNVKESALEQEVIDIPLPIGSDKQQSVKVRINQRFFRDAVLSAYDNKCCITGLDQPRLLIASHIKPWKDSDPATERTNPRNGLCLSALYDKAFDEGFMTITPEFRILLSKSLRAALPHEVVQETFLRFEGTKITTPQRFLPLKEALEWHNQLVFVE
jgi:putative restriction endonuclease